MLALGLIEKTEGQRLPNSDWLADSISTNPVVVRRLLSLLNKAGLIKSVRGKNGGVQLAKNAADINLKDINSNTPLHIACLNGNLQIAELLLQKKPGINAKNIKLSTPLYLACQNGHMQIVELLIQNGADVNSKAQNSFTPLVNFLNSCLVASTSKSSF